MTNANELLKQKDPKTIARVANILKALSNPQRLAICCLLGEKELTVTELTELVGLSQSALSQHLSRLKSLNVITYRREHNKLFYTLSSPEISAIITLLADLYCHT